jgi:NADPH:quinone reductase-like Zn-dependent oxidoreductase
MPRRLKIWQWIADELLSDKLDEIVSEDIRLAEVSDYFQRLLKRQHRGRIIVNCS